jgi:AraC-like DNA-binding protein
MAVSTTKVSHPLSVVLPHWGVLFAESIHERDFQMDWRRDGFSKLIYVLRGRVLMDRKTGSPLVISEGSFLPVEKDLRHRILDQIPPTLLLLCFSDDFPKSFHEGSKLWRNILQTKGGFLRPSSLVRNQIENLWRSSLWEQRTGQPGNAALISANAIYVLTILGRIQPKPQLDQTMDRVKNLDKKLSETFYEEWNIERACEESSLSRRHFCMLFKHATGMTFLERLTELRLKYAADLLSQKNTTILGTAFSCGYQDLSHFYRLFKQKYGISPGKWNKQKVQRS